MLNKCQIKKPTSQEAERAGDHSFVLKYAVTCFRAHPGSLGVCLCSPVSGMVCYLGEEGGGEVGRGKKEGGGKRGGEGRRSEGGRDKKGKEEGGDSYHLSSINE